MDLLDGQPGEVEIRLDIMGRRLPLFGLVPAKSALCFLQLTVTCFFTAVPLRFFTFILTTANTSQIFLRQSPILPRTIPPFPPITNPYHPFYTNATHISKPASLCPPDLDGTSSSWSSSSSYHPHNPRPNHPSSPSSLTYLLLGKDS
jgi:hypothetical protein